MAASESRLAQRVLRDFPEPGSAPEVLRLLAELATSTNDEMLASERLQAAVVLVADGNLGRLRQALDLAATDWRDVLVAAGLREVINQNLQGGALLTCHATLPYGDHPHFGPAVCAGFWARHRNDVLAGRIAQLCLGVIRVNPPAGDDREESRDAPRQAQPETP